ncbi:hypothetical protein CDL15_Pgr014641 [Punica granatum]|uniref:Uncharacterized protein n=1 Tax=Punica granatum TaxID=22663 RepID=A0A218Y0H4_PUNGR|nr:hypothetical protein CDL15_Pgr014641 [Punica granatum]
MSSVSQDQNTHQAGSQYNPSHAYEPPPIPVNPTLKDSRGTDFPQMTNPESSEKTVSKGDGFCRGLCAGLCCYCCLDICF